MAVSFGDIPIIDFHTHLGHIFPSGSQVSLEAQTEPPPSVMITSPGITDLSQLFYRNRPKLFTFGYFKHGLLSLYRKRKMIQGATIPNLQRSMQKNGIYRSVILPIAYRHRKTETSIQALIKVCLKYTETIPFCSVDPQASEAKSNLRDYIKLGARGLKLHPNFQGFRPSDIACLEICEEARQLDIPIIFHTGTKGTDRHPERVPSTLEGFEKILGTFSRTTFILGHMGISQYRLAIQLARKYENVYLETSGQPASHIQEAIQLAGGDKILFGSDWPFWDPGYPLEAVLEATKGDIELRKMILFQNAVRILKEKESL